jgi:hypothetical protein
MPLTLIQATQFRAAHTEYKTLITQTRLPVFDTLLDIYERSEMSYQSLKSQGKALQAQISDPTSEEYTVIAKILVNCKVIHRQEKQELEKLLPPSYTPDTIGEWSEEKIQGVRVLRAKWKLQYAKQMRELEGRAEFLAKMRNKFGEKCAKSHEKWLAARDEKDADFVKTYKTVSEKYQSKLELLEQRQKKELKRAKTEGMSKSKLSKLQETHEKKKTQLRSKWESKKIDSWTFEQSVTEFFKRSMAIFDRAIKGEYSNPYKVHASIDSLWYDISWQHSKGGWDFGNIYPGGTWLT